MRVVWRPLRQWSGGLAGEHDSTVLSALGPPSFALQLARVLLLLESCIFCCITQAQARHI